MLQGIKRSDLVLLVQHLLSAAGTPLSQTPAVVPAPTHAYDNNNNNNNTTTSNTTRVSQNQNTGVAAASAATSHLSMPDAVNDEPQLSQPVYQTTGEQNQHTGIFLPLHQMPPAATPVTAPDLTPTPATISLGDKPKTAFKKYSLDECHFSPVFELQLAQLQSFWMSPSSLKRQQNPVNIVTYNKRRWQNMFICVCIVYAVMYFIAVTLMLFIVQGAHTLFHGLCPYTQSWPWL